MSEFINRGQNIRNLSKSLILDYMKSKAECAPNAEGMKLAHIFRACGFDWGTYPKTTSSNQQYWVAAIMWELKEEGVVERVYDSGPWRLTTGILA